MQPNGPAIWGGCVTRRKHRAESWYPEYSGPESCHGARRVWRTFCRPGTSFIDHYECRGTSIIGAANLSPVTKFGEGTGAVSRYKFDRSQKTVKVYWILIAGRCACPGATTSTNLSWVQEQSKKCDKQLTHIVRVIVRINLSIIYS